MSFAVAAIVTGVAVAGATAYAGYTTSQAQLAAGQSAEKAGAQSAADLQKALSEATARGDLATAEAIKRQQQATQEGITAQQAGTSSALDASRSQYDKIKELLTPYVDTGTKALLQQQDIAGLNGAEAQQQAYAALKNSPAYQALNQAGQDAILANASATGGVRGGNTQGALAQFGTANLANALDRQYSQLGGLTQLGYDATSQQAGYNAQQGGMEAGLLSQSGANIAQLLASGGTNEANYTYNNGQNQSSNILNVANQAAGYQNAGTNANIQAQLGSATTMANLPVNALMGGLGAGLGIYGARPTGNIVGQPQGVSLFNQNVPFTQGGFKL